MKLYLKNGRAVAKEGRAVLCDECPCTGCQYTYYVDHSRTESGDGKTWETAFRSVNDTLNSLEISTYRLSGCIIYVKIRGTVDYAINGENRDNRNYADMWFQPENDETRVNCIVNSSILPILSDIDNAHLVFDRWDISGSADYRQSYLSTIIYNCSYVTFLDINVDFSSDVLSANSNIALFSGGRMNFIGGNIHLTAVRYEGIPGIPMRDYGIVIALENISFATIRNLSIAIALEAHGNSAEYPYFRQIIATGLDPGSCTLENIAVRISGNVSDVRYFYAAAYTPRESGPSLFVSCSGEFSVNVDHGGWDPETSNSQYCCFSGYNLEKQEFRDCVQCCEESNPDPNPGANLCNTTCKPLPASSPAAARLMSAVPASPGTSCRYAEDTGEKAFPAAPCRGNRIICRKIDGHVSYAKACRPDKCKFYEKHS